VVKLRIIGAASHVGLEVSQKAISHKKPSCLMGFAIVHAQGFRWKELHDGDGIIGQTHRGSQQRPKRFATEGKVSLRIRRNQEEARRTKILTDKKRGTMINACVVHPHIY